MGWRQIRRPFAAQMRAALNIQLRRQLGAASKSRGRWNAPCLFQNFFENWPKSLRETSLTAMGREAR